jgi:hypothetical protein
LQRQLHATSSAIAFAHAGLVHAGRLANISNTVIRRGPRVSRVQTSVAVCSLEETVYSRSLMTLHSCHCSANGALGGSQDDP